MWRSNFQFMGAPVRKLGKIFSFGGTATMNLTNRIGSAKLNLPELLGNSVPLFPSSLICFTLPSNSQSSLTTPTCERTKAPPCCLHQATHKEATTQLSSSVFASATTAAREHRLGVGARHRHWWCWECHCTGSGWTSAIATILIAASRLHSSSLYEHTSLIPAIGFAEFGHNCIITTISNCSCSMNFTMAFSLNHLWLLNKHYLENSLVFYLVDIQPWPGPATWAG